MTKQYPTVRALAALRKAEEAKRDAEAALHRAQDTFAASILLNSEMGVKFSFVAARSRYSAPFYFVEIANEDLYALLTDKHDDFKYFGRQYIKGAHSWNTQKVELFKNMTDKLEQLSGQTMDQLIEAQDKKAAEPVRPKRGRRAVPAEAQPAG